jgi:hypothetical protein
VSSEGRVLVAPQVVLLVVGGVVVAVELSGVEILEGASEVVEEGEELGCGLIGELLWEANVVWVEVFHRGFLRG